MATLQIIRTNIDSSLSEIVLWDEFGRYTAEEVLQRLFNHFFVQENVKELSLSQANQLIEVAIKWWECDDIILEYLEDDFEIIEWEEEYVSEVLNIPAKIRTAGLHVLLN